MRSYPHRILWFAGIILFLLNCATCGGGSAGQGTGGTSSPPIISPPGPPSVPTPAATRKAKFLYSSNPPGVSTVNGVGSNIAAFSVDPSTGVLTPLSNSPVTSELDPSFMTLDMQ